MTKPINEWKPVPGFGNRYLVNKNGKVWSSYVNRELTPHTGKKDGYVRINLKSKPFLLHRIVAFAFCNKKPCAEYVNHIDGNKENNCAQNLEWVTQQQNAIHCAYNISKITNAKYKPSKKEIIDLRNSGFSYGKLAEIFKVSKTTIVNWLGIKRKDTKRIKDFDVLEGEIVLQIPGYKHYYASSFGRILSKKSGGQLKPQIQPNGYAKVNLISNGKRKRHYIHRLIMLAFNGKSDLPVNHKDGDVENNSLDNLEYITQSENAKKAHKSKLSNDDYLEIYRLKQLGISRKQISKMFNIHKCYVNVICRKVKEGLV